MDDTFVGAVGERLTQSTTNAPAGSSASDTEFDPEEPPPDRASATSHHQFPDHSGMPYPREYRPTPLPPNTKYERRGGNFMPTLVFPSAKSDHLKTGDDNNVGEYTLGI